MKEAVALGYQLAELEILCYYLQLAPALIGIVALKSEKILKRVFIVRGRGAKGVKRIIISGGGTGGHIYPAITIYKEIMKQNLMLRSYMWYRTWSRG